MIARIVTLSVVTFALTCWTHPVGAEKSWSQTKGAVQPDRQAEGEGEGEAEPTHRVWLDVDPANGIGEIDDGLALIQAFHSPELEIAGVSSVFGNAEQPHAHRLAVNITRTFGPADVAIDRGAASAEARGKANDAVAGMAEALEAGPMTILALGPVTNVATLLERHPDLSDRIERIVVVAGRREGQKFHSVADQPRPFRDFNFELDPEAMRVLLESGVPLVMAPWEVSSHVWVTRDDLARLQESGGTGLFIAATSQHWIDLWENELNAPGFNPFDTLAVGYLTHPDLIEGMKVSARIEYAASDQPGETDEEKPYLVVKPSDEPNAGVTYLHTPDARFKAMLLNRLAGAKQPAPTSEPEHES